MTRIYITIDTEYAYKLPGHEGCGSREANFARSISCETRSGVAGLEYQMDVFDRYGLKAVFFVDPMPALVWGLDAVSDVVGPIVRRGHDVQLHVHTEWLGAAERNNPLGKRVGTNIKDFTLDEQYRLLEFARATLIAAGAPAPVAFRAGNYGANDDTLRALARLGIAYDTSHCPGIRRSPCDISLGPTDQLPVSHCGVIEVPIGCIGTYRGGLRHAQLTALSADEILAAVRHAHLEGASIFTLVSHSFELLSRDRTKINQIVKRRFEKLCARIARLPGIFSGTYASHPPMPANPSAPCVVLPHNPFRTCLRLAQQAAANALYGRR